MLPELQQSFITLLSDDDSDASDDDTDPLFWHIFVAWKVIPTGLGDDLSKLYGMVVKHYEVHPLADTPYPLSASLMKKMLKHKLEV
ncbi:hypothetical protein Tco_0059852 [Tanacetum coccineum]